MSCRRCRRCFAVLHAIASGALDFSLAKGLAANGHSEHSPSHYGLFSGLVAEVGILTMMFLFIIIGSTHGKAPAGFAPLPSGLA
jgi:aquaporin Z